MMPEVAAMLEEWPTLTPEQAEDIAQLSETMRDNVELADVAIARLVARAVRFHLENAGVVASTATGALVFGLGRQAVPCPLRGTKFHHPACEKPAEHEGSCVDPP